VQKTPSHQINDAFAPDKVGLASPEPNLLDSEAELFYGSVYDYMPEKAILQCRKLFFLLFYGILWYNINVQGILFFILLLQ